MEISLEHDHKIIVENYIHFAHHAAIYRLKHNKDVLSQRGQCYYLNANSQLALFNGIFDFSPDERFIEKQLEYATHLFSKLKLSFSWWWLKNSVIPKSIEDLLQQKGFVSAGVYSGVLLELSSAHFIRKSSDSIVIREVKTQEEYQTYLKILSESFQLPEPITKEFELMMNPSYENIKFTHYMGYLNDNPVGILTTYIEKEIVGLYSGATLPNSRNQGVLSSIMHFALEQAATKGCKIAVAQLMANNMAAGAVKRLGFKTISQFTPYIYTKS